MRSRLLLGASIGVAALAGALAAGASGAALPRGDDASAQAKLRTGYIAPNVRVDGVPVGNMPRREAVAKLLKARAKPGQKKLAVRVGGTRFAVSPRAAGYKADVRYAVRAAYNFGRSKPVPKAGIDVPLRVSVNLDRVERIVRARARKFDVAPRSASIGFRGSTPIITNARKGRAIVQKKAVEILADRLVDRRRAAVRLPVRRLAPERTSAPPTVLIDRSRFRLTLFSNGRTRSFTVAVGQTAHPTPPGVYHTINEQPNPTWFPPSSPWAAGLGPVPPGPGNPLGRMWMGLDRNLIGIHGTSDPSSLGTAASHGCIRMSNDAVLWLSNRISVGTRVVIV